MNVDFVLQLLLNGLILGLIYALVAMGLSLIFGVLEIVNFAHGEFYMLAAMGCYFLTAGAGFGYWGAVVAVTAVSVCVGFVLYEVLLRRLGGRDFERSILLTLGLSMVLQNGALYLWTATPRMTTTQYTYESVVLGPVQAPLVRILAVVLAVISFVSLYLVLHHTRVGKAMRGVAQNRDAALMVGIDPRVVSRLAVAVGVGLSGVAGAALAPVYSVHPLMGFAFLFKAFAIVIIGGLGNVAGAAIAAVALGILESLASGFFSLVVVDGLAFVLMILVLLVRPHGLFGGGVRV